MFLFNNCKKGANDPLLSLKSRKARLSKEWKIKEWSVEAKQKDTNPLAINPTSSMKRTIQEGLFYQKSTGNWGSSEESGKVISALWKIEKDNKWNKVISFTTTLNNVTTTTIMESSGTWYFLNKIDGYKNKERVAFTSLVLKETKLDSYANGTSNSTENVTKWNDGDRIDIYTITQLKNKETILERETMNKSTQSSTLETTSIEKYLLVKQK